MSAETGISWCDSTVNFWFGCAAISPACDNCYAEARMDKRLHRVEWGAGKPRKRTSAKYWRDAAKLAREPFCECMNCGWRGQARDAELRDNVHGMEFGSGAWRICPTCDKPLLMEARRRIFSLSLGDWLDLDVPIEWFVDMLDTIRTTPESDWLLLSKRIGNWRKRIEEARIYLRQNQDTQFAPELHDWMGEWQDGNAPANAWIGATVVNQEEVNRDVPKLLAVPARVRFLSMEPLLGPVDLTRIELGDSACVGIAPEWKSVERIKFFLNALTGAAKSGIPAIGWVICGGESGSQARPMHPAWVRSLRDQCEAASVRFHFKQWGEWAPGQMLGRLEYSHGDGTWSWRAGKREAGRQLDGREWNEFPKVPA